MGKYKTRKRYRLTFANENTFNDVWTLRLTRGRVWLLSGLCVAAIAALVVVVMLVTPLSTILPGGLKPAERRASIAGLERVDSLLEVTQNQQLYMQNLLNILSDSADTPTPSDTMTTEVTDTLLSASEAEREYILSWAERDRNALSVLTPVVAEGMMFRSPAAGAVLSDDGTSLQVPRGATVCAINDGVVISRMVDAATGMFVVTIQHANDFLSVTSGIATPLVETGAKVVSGQALGLASSSGIIPLAVWHEGRPVALKVILPATE